MIRPHYCRSYSKTGVGSFRGDAAAHLNHGGKIQIPKLTEIQSASFTEDFFKSGDADMNITNGRRANCSHPLPICYFIIFILLNVLHVSTVVFSACPHVTTMRVSLQFIWLLKLKQDIVEQVQIKLLKLSLDMTKWRKNPTKKTLSS